MPRQATDPWPVIATELKEHRALKALEAGEATPEQQRLALRWILFKACGLLNDTHSSDTNLSFYRQGKRSVAIEINAVLTAKADEFRKSGEKDL